MVGHDIIDAIRHMEGVVTVRDRLSYPSDPTNRTSAPS
jgi:type III secretory pathway lipoprotein EscJ